MFKKLLFLIAGLTLSVNSITQAQDLIQISDTQTWATFDEGGFGPEDTLQILAGGHLTITERCGIDNGRILIVEEGGLFTMNARLDTNSRGQIIMNGGEFYNTVDFKFTDSKGDQDCHIWLYGGLMVCHNIEADKTRNAWFHIGGGIIRVGDVSGHRRHDPESTEEDTWGILVIPPYTDYVVIDLGNDWKEVRALPPSPYDGEKEVQRDTVISWPPGKYAVTYDLYLGTDSNDVNEATRDNPLDVLVSQGQEETTYAPPEPLEFNQTYYWRVDEVNDAEPNSPLKGDILSFTTANYIIIEDFEDYNDFEPDTVWNTWADGYDDETNGSSAGYPNPNFFNDEHYLEDEIIHSGDWSMPLFYDNSSAMLSEVTKTLNADWATEGFATLSLWYNGLPFNIAEPMYVALNGNAVVTNNNANAALVTEWTQWDIPLQTFADQGVDLANVGTLSIGFGNKANPVRGGAGNVFIDDIRLYLP